MAEPASLPKERTYPEKFGATVVELKEEGEAMNVGRNIKREQKKDKVHSRILSMKETALRECLDSRIDSLY